MSGKIPLKSLTEILKKIGENSFKLVLFYIILILCKVLVCVSVFLHNKFKNNRFRICSV